jgi:uncharacterized membrane protein
LGGPEDSGGLRLRVVNRVGAFTVVLGVLFFFKYAVDENLVGPLAGIWLALLFGLTFLVSGEFLYLKSLPVLAQGITGTGLAVIFTAVYAAFAYYKLLSEFAGFAGLLLVCLASILLSFRYANGAIASLGFLGALSTPVLLSHVGGSVTARLFYFLVVMAADIFVAHRMRWVALTPVMTAIALLCAGLEFGRRHTGALLFFALALAVAHFGIALPSRDENKSKAGFLVAGHLAFLTAGASFIQLQGQTASVRSELDSILLACYGIALLLLGSLRALPVERAVGSVLLGIVILKLYLVDIWSLAQIYRVSAFVGLGALLLLASYLYSRSDKSKAST